MKCLRNNLLAGFVIFLMLASIISSTLISYHVEKRMPTGKLVEQGTVSLTVGGDTPVTPPESPGGGGGSSGGEEESVLNEIDLDFTLQDNYKISPSLNEKINIIFLENKKYVFNIVELGESRITFEIQGNQYMISVSEIGYFDLDSDGIDDLKVIYDGEFLTVVSLYIPEKTIEPPKMTTKKIVDEIPIISETGGIANYIILIGLVIITLFILLYQHFKFTSLKKSYQNKAKKIHEHYKKKEETFSRKEMLIIKLQKQKELLENAYFNKHISKQGYDKELKIINKGLKEAQKK